MKQCFKCGEEKPLTEFYEHQRMADGHLGKCKECTKKDSRANRRKRIEYYREYDRKRGAHGPEDKTVRYRSKNPEKYYAHTAVSNAIRSGELMKPNNCEKCGAERLLHAHHPDYSKPLDVEWLCVPCHTLAHGRVLNV